MTVTVARVEIDAEKLRALRRAQVLSIREVAEKAGVSKNTVHKIEHGSTNAHPATIRKLAEALDIPPAELLR